MCGIVGIIGKKNKKIMCPVKVWDMMKVQKHRGPDDFGAVYYDSGGGNSTS